MVSITPRPLYPRGKNRYPLYMYRRMGGPQGRSGRVRKISPPPGFDPRTVQPVAINTAGSSDNNIKEETQISAVPFSKTDQVLQPQKKRVYR